MIGRYVDRLQRRMEGKMIVWMDGWMESLVGG